MAEYVFNDKGEEDQYFIMRFTPHQDMDIKSITMLVKWAHDPTGNVYPTFGVTASNNKGLITQTENVIMYQKFTLCHVNFLDYTELQNGNIIYAPFRALRGQELTFTLNQSNNHKLFLSGDKVLDFDNYHIDGLPVSFNSVRTISIWNCTIDIDVIGDYWNNVENYPDLINNPRIDFSWSIDKNDDPKNQGIWRFKDGINEGYPFIILPLEAPPSPSSNLFIKTKDTENLKPLYLYLKTPDTLIPLNLLRKE